MDQKSEIGPVPIEKPLRNVEAVADHSNFESRQLIAFIALQVVMVIVSAVLPCKQLEWFTCQIMFGIVIMQGALAGLWFVFGPGWFSLRLLAVPVWLVLSAGVAGISDRPSDAFTVLLVCGMGAAITTGAAAGIAKFAFGMRLQQGLHAATISLQYNLKHLMMLMAAVSVLMAASKFVGPHLRGLTFGEEFLVSVGLGSAWGLSLVPAIIVVLAASSERHLLYGLIVAAACNVMISALSAVVAEQSTLFGPRDFPFLIVTVGCVSAVGITVSLFPVRLAKYRLTKQSGWSSQPAARNDVD